MRYSALIPAYQAEDTIGDVVRELRSHWPMHEPIVIVVDDGSTDGTARAARAAGARVIGHSRNLGKGTAIRTGLSVAAELGAQVAVTVDADGQHPALEAIRLLTWDVSERALVLGVRNLRDVGAPRANQLSNAFSNAWVSWLAGQRLLDTQCGLRRYSVPGTINLGTLSRGYGFEAEVILRAARAGWTIEQVPVQVIYPPEHLRVTHFHSVRDPARIVFRVLHTAATATSNK
jgi:glycosyltransferase involved in cell wall biosynthesis